MNFLVGEGYDPALTDLIVNETQAYLMHTADKRAFSAEAVRLSEEKLHALREAFLKGMPPSWLRDETSVPPVPTTGLAKASAASAP